MSNPNIAKVKASTTNVKVFTWGCVFCKTNNKTFETHLLPNKHDKTSRYATCECCGTTHIIVHHTFK